MPRLELARELNLRRWARLNYVPLATRPRTWHPVVLNEMQNQDAEQAEMSSPTSMATRYVPLFPTQGWDDPSGAYCGP
jgi:hypothetical protein